MSTYNISLVLDPSRAVAGAQRVEVALKGVENQANRANLSLNRLAGTIFSAYAVTQLVNLARAFDGIETRVGALANASLRSGDAIGGLINRLVVIPDIMERIFTQSHRTGTRLDENVDSLRALVNALAPLGIELERATDIWVKFNDAISALEASPAEVTRVTRALTQALATGRLTLEQTRDLMVSFRPLAEAIAARLGIAVRDLPVAAAGMRITSGVVVNALESLDTAGPAASSIERSLNRVYDSIVRLAGASGFTDLIKYMFGSLSNTLNSFATGAMFGAGGDPAAAVNAAAQRAIRMIDERLARSGLASGEVERLQRLRAGFADSVTSAASAAQDAAPREPTSHVLGDDALSQAISKARRDRHPHVLRCDQAADSAERRRHVLHPELTHWQVPEDPVGVLGQRPQVEVPGGGRERVSSVGGDPPLAEPPEGERLAALPPLARWVRHLSRVEDAALLLHRPSACFGVLRPGRRADRRRA